MIQKYLNSAKAKYILPGLVVLSLILNLGLAVWVNLVIQTNRYLYNANQSLTSQIQEMKNGNEDASETQKDTESEPNLPENIYFTGQIINKDDPNAERLNISGSLNIKSDEVFGVYIYDKNSEPIKLTGKITKDEESTSVRSIDYKTKLQEENLDGEKTGIWNLKFSFNKNVGLSSNSNELMEYTDLFYSFNSTWQKDENSKPLDFNLDASVDKIILPEFNKNSNKLKISTKIHEIRTSDYWIYYKYPEISGLTDQKVQDKINAEFIKYADVNKTEVEIKNVIKDSLKNEFKCSDYSDSLNFDLKYNQNGLLSVIFTGYWYGCGAHGSNTIKTLNFNLKDGSSLNLSGVFKPDSKYLEQISQPEKLADDGLKPTPENFENWVFTKDGLEITFRDNQLGAYALGNPTVNISYDKLKDFMQLEIYNKLTLK